MGGRPTGSGASASAGGYGAQTVDANGAGVLSHLQSTSISNGVTSTNTDPSYSDGHTYNTQAGTDVFSAMIHSHTMPGHSIGLDSVNTEPADYSLVYIMKL